MKHKINVFATILLSVWWCDHSGAVSIENLGSLSSATTMRIPSESGSVDAICRERQFSERFNSKYVSRHTALLVMIPQRHIYWLGYKTIGVGDQRKFFLLGDHIVGVSTYSGDILNFYISSEQLPSNDLEDSARTAFDSRFSSIGNRRFDVQEYSISMVKILGVFPFEQVTAQGEPAPEITNISVTEGAFTLTFRGGKQNNIEATITFGSDFRPISATLKGKQIFPKAPTPSPTPR